MPGEVLDHHVSRTALIFHRKSNDLELSSIFGDADDYSRQPVAGDDIWSPSIRQARSVTGVCE